MSLLRRSRAKFLRRALLFLAVAWLCLDVLQYIHFRRSSSKRYLFTDFSNKEKQKIFIVSTHWNNEYILRNYWNKAVVNLVEHFGPTNVFVSVYESGSWDDSKGALRELQDDLERIGTRHKIVLDETTHLDEIQKPPAATGWIDTPRGTKEVRRIPYLSMLRNRSLEPLDSLLEEGVLFDKILFLNDVIFTLEDVLSLLHTRNGDYAAVCSLDFSKPPRYYDTFALRDFEGHEAVMSTWPYFRSYTSRAALKRGDPVPMSSCWNGMTIMRTQPFYDKQHPLRFRGLPDSLAAAHLEASECCLIHQDNPLSLKRGVFVNPHVKVAYNKGAYDHMNGPEGDLRMRSFLYRSWENRLRRWLTTDWFKSRVVRARLKQWERKSSSNTEMGIDCIINEMQVLVHNGWAHL